MLQRVRQPMMNRNIARFNASRITRTRKGNTNISNFFLCRTTDEVFNIVAPLQLRSPDPGGYKIADSVNQVTVFINHFSENLYVRLTPTQYLIQ